MTSPNYSTGGTMSVRLLVKILITSCTLLQASLSFAQLRVFAAENFYAQLAAQIGGYNVNVTTVNPNQHEDPHLYTPDVQIITNLVDADLIIMNGLDYDKWVSKQLRQKKDSSKLIINVSKLMGLKYGDNPHIWYLPTTMPVLAEQLVSSYCDLDPYHCNYYQSNLHNFYAKYKHLSELIMRFAGKNKNKPVIATEPVFNYLSDSLGLTMHGKAFQLAIMNEVQPPATSIAQFRNMLTSHKAKVFIYNKQVNQPLLDNLRALATKEKIPTLGVSETLPHNNIDYVEWMSDQITDLDKMLNHSTKKKSSG